jgi:hypothetical protein
LSIGFWWWLAIRNEELRFPFTPIQKFARIEIWIIHLQIMRQ